LLPKTGSSWQPKLLVNDRGRRVGVARHGTGVARFAVRKAVRGLAVAKRNAVSRAVALSSTMRRFQINLADSDRGVYEALDLRVAQHPSESDVYLVARMLARSLEHAEGIEFSPGGVSDDVLPALVQRDLTGQLLAWIEVSSPSADRLHKATKKCKRVAVYTWKNPEKMVEDVVERKVHRADELELFALPVGDLEAIAKTLDRVNKWELAVTGGTIYLTVGDASFETSARRLAIE